MPQFVRVQLLYAIPGREFLHAEQNGIRIRRVAEFPNGGLIQTVKNVPYIANKSVGWHTRPEFYDQFMGENSELAQIMNG